MLFEFIEAPLIEDLNLSDEATAFFEQKNCPVELLPTPEALKVWNQAEGAVIAVFHVTC